MSDFFVAFMVVMAFAALTTFGSQDQSFASTSACKIEVGSVKLCW